MTVGFSVRLARLCDTDHFVDFNQRVLFSEESIRDPFCSSLRKELSYAINAVHELNDFVCFLLIKDSSQQIIGRGLINTRPTPDDYDICAYSREACDILASKRCAVLGGDLIEPAFRDQGLHMLLIQARVDWAMEHSFNYLFVPIMRGNDKSLHNYQKLGAKPLGAKLFRYETLVEIDLYGVSLFATQGVDDNDKG